MLRISNFNKKLISIVCTLLLCLNITSPLMVERAFADVGDFKNPSNGQVSALDNKNIYEEAEENMFSLSTDDITGFDAIANWLLTRETYIFCQELPDGGENIFFNTPNLQRAVVNMLQDLNDGGIRFQTYDASFLDSSNKKEWVTAAKKYGYNLPNNPYLGEMPAIQLDMSAVAGGVATLGNGIRVLGAGAANSILNLGKSFLDLITGQEHEDESYVDLDLDFGEIMDNIKNMRYNTEDYTSVEEKEDETLSKWLGDNWGEISGNPGSYNNDVKVGAEGSEKGILDAIDYENIPAKEDGESSESYGRKILNKFISTCGASYTLVLSSVIDVAEKDGIAPPVTVVTRNMPYETEDMSPSSLLYMQSGSEHNGAVVADPRVSMFGASNDSTSIGIEASISNEIRNIVASVAINIVGMFCSFSALINSICSFDFFESAGLDIDFLWGGTIGTFIFQCFAIMIVVMLIIGIIRLVKDGNGAQALVKTGFMCLVLALFMCVSLMPDKTCGLLQDIANRVTNISAITLENQDAFDEMCSSEANVADKSDMRFWYMYYNTWASYQTNHTTSDDEANKYDPDSEESKYRNEYTDYDIFSGKDTRAILSDGKKMELWPIIFAEENLLQSNNAYRTVDHYMAPIVVKDSFPEFYVLNNNFYNKGYMQSSIPWGAVIACISLLILSILKLMCFIELVVNIMMLMIRLLLSSAGGIQNMGEPLKEIGWSIFRVAICDTLISLLVYSSSILKGDEIIVIGLFILIALIAFIVQSFKHPNGVLIPGMFKVIGNTYSRAKNVVYGNTIRYQGAAYDSGDSNQFSAIQKDMYTRRKERENLKKNYLKTKGGSK